MKNSAVVISILTLLVSAQSIALCRTEQQVSSSTPTSQFTDHGNGTVTDTKTGLMWAKCALGQSGSDCYQSPIEYDWAQALDVAAASVLAGYTDWRLPNVKELRSIVERRCYEPSINEAVFPNTPLDFFWSASPSADDSFYAWYVDFEYGYSFNYFRDYGYHVRLVRSG